MQRLLDILVFIGAMAGSLIVALVVTWFAYEFWIPERAFHCTDDAMPIGFWTSADGHRTAGDEILAGWTWEKLGHVNNIFEAAFFALWIGGGVGAFRVSRTILRDYVGPAAEPAHEADRSQPIHSTTNSTESAAGSSR